MVAATPVGGGGVLLSMGPLATVMQLVFSKTIGPGLQLRSHDDLKIKEHLYSADLSFHQFIFLLPHSSQSALQHAHNTASLPCVK